MAMFCPCSTNALRLFIRTLAKVEVQPGVRPLERIQKTTYGHAITSSRIQNTSLCRGFTSNSHTWAASASAVQAVENDGREGIPRKIEEVVEHVNYTTAPQDAVVDFSPGVLDEILAEAQNEQVYAIPDLESVVVDDTPQRFVADAFEKQRAQRERRRRHTELRYAEEAPDTVQNHARHNEHSPERSESQPHSTFPRLPRISHEPLSTTPLRSRTEETFKPTPRSKDYTPPPREQWQIEKAAVKAKYPSGYAPAKRLSPDAVTGIRALHAQMPEEYHTRKLAETFQVSPEAISRILRTKWTPNAEEEADRARRWLKRGESVWTRYAEMGVKPPKRWREAGIGRDSEVLRLAAEKKREKRKQMGIDKEPPALVTLPRRPGGLYSVGGRRKSPRGDHGAGFI